MALHLCLVTICCFAGDSAVTLRALGGQWMIEVPGNGTQETPLLGVVVELELPGVCSADIEVSICNVELQQLVIGGVADKCAVCSIPLGACSRVRATAIERAECATTSAAATRSFAAAVRCSAAPVSRAVCVLQLLRFGWRRCSGARTVQLDDGRGRRSAAR